MDSASKLLSGRVSDLLMADVSSNTGKVSSRDTIEFEVNQECECFVVVLFMGYTSFFLFLFYCNKSLIYFL